MIVGTVVFSALAWCAIGCGGGGATSTGSEDSPLTQSSPPTTDETPSTTTSEPAPEEAKPLSRAAFLEQANAICKEGGKEIQAAQQPFLREHGIKSKTAVSRKQSEEFIDEAVAPGVAAQAQAIAALKAPVAIEQNATALVQGLEAVADAGEKDPAAILQEDSGVPLQKVNDIAKALGAAECTQP